MTTYIHVLTLMVLVGACAGNGLGKELRFTGIPSKCIVRKLETKSAGRILLSNVAIPVVQPHGGAVSVPAELCETEYHSEWHEFNRLGQEDKAQDVYCYELRTIDSKKPFHRYLWSDLPLGRFHFWTTATSRSYVTCVSAFLIWGYQIGKTQDKASSFSDWVVMTKPATKEFLVPVSQLAGHRPFISSAMDAQYADIEVVSLAETAGGVFTIQFRGEDASKTYTAKSDPSTALKWRLVE